MEPRGLYGRIGTEVQCPAGRGVLLQVFEDRATVHVPGIRKGRDRREVVVFCDPSEVSVPKDKSA